jgi:hypothetical protein
VVIEDLLCFSLSDGHPLSLLLPLKALSVEGTHFLHVYCPATYSPNHSVRMESLKLSDPIKSHLENKQGADEDI